MNEEEWLRGTDPNPMLQYLIEQRTGERKLRLLACACCRLIWEHLPDPKSRAAVEVAERFADDKATSRELAHARNQALAAISGASRAAGWAVYWATNTKASGPLWNAFAAAVAAAPAKQASEEAVGHKAAIWDAVQAESIRDQVHLIRDIIGNPFHTVEFNPMWRIWEGGTISQLAEAIYEEQNYERMPVLGDALEEAGCAEEAILQHCRSQERHFRGCWVVDVILDRV